MKRIRYLSLLLMLLCSAAAWAQEFNPSSPAEPSEIPWRYKLTIAADPAEAVSSITKDGKYVAGTSVTLNATAKSGWTFVNWTDEEGNAVTSPYTTKAKAETLTAHFKYTPGAPDEPGEISKAVRYWLTLAVEEGGSASGGGRYKIGTNNTVTASANTGYTFVGWYDSEGEILLSSNTSYQTTMVEGGLTLLAKFKYTPDNPDEPAELKNRYRINLEAGEGGTAEATSMRLATGETTTITAHPNTGYDFEGWYHNGDLRTKSPQFTYTMESANITFEARFKFNPDSPDEPSPAKNKNYTFYLMNIIGKPGSTVRFPVYLSSHLVSKGMTFQLTFPTELVPTNLQNPDVADRASGFIVSCSDGSDVEEGQSAYVFTLSGSTSETTLPIDNTPLLIFDIDVPANQETGQGYPVYINQISVTNDDDTTEGASARHGRVSVYKNGDTNGYNDVNSADVLNIVSVVLQKETEVFISEVSDINEDGEFTSADVLGIVNIVLDN